MRTIFFSMIALIGLSLSSHGQDLPTFDWKIVATTTDAEAGDTLRLIFETAIPDGLHIYGSKFECEFGPNPSSLVNVETDGVNADGDLISVGVVSEYDDIFMCDINYFEKKAHFEQRLTMTGASGTITGTLEYQVCLEDGMCILKKEQFTILIE